MRDRPKDELRYYNLSRYYRQRFGGLVYKASLDAGFSCPNRDGTVGWDGCTFCNNIGFSPPARLRIDQLHDQLRYGIAAARHRRALKVIAYLQAYTNTYAPLDQLREVYEQVWAYPEIAGLAIGTRPDCVDADIIDLVADQARQGEVWIEYGLQSSFDETLARIRRGHTYQQFLDAIEMTRGRGIRICVHTILGLPGETAEMMIETHRRIGQLPIDGIKIHLLHVMRNTPLADACQRSEITLLSRSDYVRHVADALAVLPPRIVVQRLHADAPADVLVGPTWCLDKMRTLHEIRQCQIARDTWQGKELGHTHEELSAILAADIPPVSPNANPV